MSQQQNRNLPAPIVQNLANVSAKLADIVTSAAVAAATSVVVGVVRSFYLTIYQTYVEIKITTDNRRIDGRIERLETIADKYNNAILKAQDRRDYSTIVQKVLLDSLELDLRRQMERVLQSA
ncbi:MAG: hypothetical protein ACRDIV_22280 [Ktedonobacteraceae bacterium]